MREKITHYIRAGYAGLYQRVFVGLLMAWTLLIALGIAL